MPTGTPAEINHWANLYTFYSRNVSKLARYLLAQQQAQLDTATTQALSTTPKLLEADERKIEGRKK